MVFDSCSRHCSSFSRSNAFFSSFFTSLQRSMSALVIWIAPRCSGKTQFRLSVSVCFAPAKALSQGSDDAGMARIVVCHLPEPRPYGSFILHNGSLIDILQCL